MSKVKFNRIGALTGLFASVLLFAANIINDIEVSATTTSSTIAATLISNQTSILVGTYMVMIGVFLLLFFNAYLRQFLLDRDNGDHWLLSAGFSGGLVAAAMLLLAAHFNQAFTILTEYGSETQVAKALYLLDWNWYLLVEAPAFAAMIGSISIFSLRHKALPGWLNWTGVLITVLLLLPFVTGGGIMLAYLWLGATASVVLVKSGRK